MFKKLFLITLLAMGLLSGCQSQMTGEFIHENQNSRLILKDGQHIEADNEHIKTQGVFHNILEQQPNSSAYAVNDYHAQFRLVQNQQGIYPDPFINTDFLIILPENLIYRLTSLESDEQYTIAATESKTLISWTMYLAPENTSQSENTSQKDKDSKKKQNKLGKQLYYNAVAASQPKPNLSVSPIKAEQYLLTLTLPGTYRKEGSFYTSDNGDFYTFVQWGSSDNGGFKGIYYRQGEKSILQLTSITESDYSGKLPAVLYNEATTDYFEVDTSQKTLDLPVILTRNKDYLSVKGYSVGENYRMNYSKS